MMKKILFALFLCLLPASAYSATLTCEGFYQEAEKELERKPLALEVNNAAHRIFAGSLHGFDFRADWDRALVSVFLKVSQGGKEVLYSTARLTSATQPQTYASATQPDGSRVWLTCLMR